MLKNKFNLVEAQDIRSNKTIYDISCLSVVNL